MPLRSAKPACRLLATTALACGLSAAAHAGGTYAELHPFAGGKDGAQPMGRLVGDAFGNLYGSASDGGMLCAQNPSLGCGTLFKLDPTGTLTTIFSFPGGANGSNPSTSLTLARGILFGGAFAPPQSPLVFGLLFSIQPDGTFYTVTHTFDGVHGRDLTGALQPVANGGLFGVSEYGGANYLSKGTSLGEGVLFYISTKNKYRVVHLFKGGVDGRNPTNLIEDASGNMFGSTLEGGVACPKTAGCGTIFEYAPATGIYSTLYSFTDATDGAFPTLGSVGSDGTLYGVTGRGSQTPHGVLFSLTPSAGGYSFATLSPIVSNTAGEVAIDPPALTAKGGLVGATGYRIYGFDNGQFTTLLDYKKAGLTLEPVGQLTVSPSDIIYGTSALGGTGACAIPATGGCGNIFQYTPAK